MNSRPLVYLAGPEVFLTDTAAIGQAKKDICAKYGLEGIFPIDTDIDVSAYEPFAAAMLISEKNESLMRAADAIIANTTPWHGPSLDVGTAFEIGFMRALGKPVFVYTNDARMFFERVNEFFGGAVDLAADGRWRERTNGTALESWPMHDNLMIDGAAHASGGCVIAAAGDRLRGMDSFETAVAAVARHFKTAAVAA